MQLWKTLKIASVFALAVSSTGVLAQTTNISADIPTSASGTYSLTYTTGTTPFAANTKKTFVIDGAADTLCVDGKSLGKAFLRTPGAAEPLWADGTTYFGLSLVNGNFNEINVYTNANNSWVGQFTGTRTSTSAACSGGSTTTPTISAQAQSMFDLAAQVFPTLLVNGSALGLYEGYVYKFFPISGIYVGIKDDIVYTLGGAFGNAITPQGSVAVVLSVLQAEKARIDQQNNNPIPSGLYNLKITGFVQVAGFTQPIPNNVTIASVPAPRPSEREVFEESIKTGFGVTSIVNYKISVINDTPNRVTYRVEFSVTSPVAMVYDLTYDYTK